MSGPFLTLDGVPGIFVVWKGEIVPLISPCLNQPGLQDCPTRCRGQHCHFSRHKWNRVPGRTSAKHMKWLGMWPKLCVWSWTPLILSRPRPAVYIRLRNVVPEFLGNYMNLYHQYCPTHIPYVGPPPGVIELVVWKLRAQLDDPCFLGAHILILSPFKWRGQTHNENTTSSSNRLSTHLGTEDLISRSRRSLTASRRCTFFESVSCGLP